MHSVMLGKTLAYVLPIIETLISRIIPRIRALIILPTRDLAIQVRNTFDQYIKGSNLKCILLTGQSSFSLEAKSLFTDANGELCDEPMVDIVIATPGRLLDHLNNTKGFSLAHLRFLVIDEADRLLNQSYQNWLPNVLASTDGDQNDLNGNQPQTRRYKEFDFDQRTLMAYTPLQKLLFSATLNQNPAQIAPLKLHNTTIISVKSTIINDDSQISKRRKIDDDDSLQMVLPPTLSEYFVATDASDDKPLTCLTLVFKYNISGVIIFTKSVETAHRLAFIFNQFSKNANLNYQSQAISSDAKKSDRKEWINDFKNGKINAIISSDLLARGIDFGESVTAVINYDVPTTIQTFTHRVGRCARAGRAGKAYSILEGHQVKWFRSQMANVSRTTGNGPEKLRINQTQLKEYQEFYIQALSELEKSVKNISKSSHFDNDTRDGDTSDGDVDTSDEELDDYSSDDESSVVSDVSSAAVDKFQMEMEDEMQLSN